MNKRKCIPTLLALLALGLLMAEFPPFQITWRHFFDSQVPILEKVGFLLKVYGLPFSMSFIAIILFQLQGRLTTLGASAASVFPMALLGAAGMMTAFRSMVSGIGGVPGYALGMALAYTMMSRMHSLQPSGRMLFGRPMLRVVWRGEIEAQRRASAGLQAREEQRNVSSSTSNSVQNNTLSLSRAEAGT